MPSRARPGGGQRPAPACSCLGRAVPRPGGRAAPPVRQAGACAAPWTALPPWAAGERQGAGITPQATPKFLAFVKTDEPIQVPLDAYSILGVSTMASRDSVLKAYERLVMASPAPDLSQELLCSRAVVLKAAADVLMDAAARAAYEQDGLLEILREDLPGCIALLAECGDWEAGLEWGAAWLQRAGSAAVAKDVAVCVAMSGCSKAAALLEADPEDAAGAVAALQSAAGLLQRHGSGGAELRQDIARTLRELQPRMLLQQLAQPDGSTAERSETIAALRALLWGGEGGASAAASFPGLKMSRRQYLDAACRQMSAAEQVLLFEGAELGPGAPDSEVYAAAMAHLAAGLRTHTPAHLKTAAKLLAAIDAKVEPATGRRRFDAMDVSVELASCSLLLGEAGAAEAALGLGPDAASAPDPVVKQFIQDHAGQAGGDPLPGLCRLVRQWLEEVAADSFPELQEGCLDLEAWFAHPRIKLYLQVTDQSRKLGLPAAVEQLRSRAAAAFAGLMAALAALLRLLTSPARLLGGGAAQQPAAAPASPAQAGDSVDALLDALSPVDSAPPTALPSRLPTGVSSQIVPAPGAAARAATASHAAPAATAEEEQAAPAEPGAGLPLAEVTDQTIGQLQHIQDALPLDENEDGFSSEYGDAPLPSAAGRGVPRLLVMEGEHDMWATRPAQRGPASLLLSAATLAAAGWAAWSLAQQGSLPRRTAAELFSHTAKAMAVLCPPPALLLGAGKPAGGKQQPKA